MANTGKWLLRVLLAGGFSAAIVGCETIIEPKLDKADPVLVVDAWLTNRSEIQNIRLSRTVGYFDNQELPGVDGATVTVVNESSGRTFIFSYAGAGNYQWSPADPSDSLGTSGDAFSLSVSTAQGDYSALSAAGRVPRIDSISWIFQPGGGFLPDSYLAEFFATDPVGRGDTYWIKAWKNDTLLLRPSEINLAFDAGFSEGGNFDGVTFITPIRRGVTPVVTDADGNFLSPFKDGDSLYVEIHSITRAAFNFMTEVAVQTDRPGGFQELFAAPAANVSTNIVGLANAAPAVGFFNVAGVSGKGRKFREP